MTTRTGWHIDPTGRHRLRYRGDAGWTTWVADGAEEFLDPIGAVDDTRRKLTVAIHAGAVTSFVAASVVVLAGVLLALGALSMDQEDGQMPDAAFLVAGVAFAVAVATTLLAALFTGLATAALGVQYQLGPAPRRVRGAVLAIVGAAATVGVLGAVAFVAHTLASALS